MSELPTGTVTFLFTDLEGSTRLWEEHPEAMKAALARHDEILRHAVEKHDGSIVKTTGDGLHATFGTAHDAALAAVDAQRALDDEQWTLPEPLRVRMGIHTGEADLRDGDYFGPAVNRAARVSAAAHGGQILVSHATEELVRDTLEHNAVLQDLGEHRLRDLARPERLYQLSAPDTPQQFPPVRSLDAYPGNLPSQLTSFVGRERELASLATALDQNRLVTLTGVGGVGKTRLATQLAAEVLPQFGDGAWLCELAAADDDDALVQVVAATLGVRPRPGLDLDESIAEFLRVKQLLVVLDNCEHLLVESARLAELILHDCPSVRIVATSREGLAVEGEHVVPLRSLGLPPKRATDAELETEAIRLFADRAASARDGFVLDQTNLPAVAEICRRLDGMPLAIELAAARVVAMSPSDIAARLDERFRLLTGGRRTAVERHQTLRATVDWSYSMLDEREQTVFQRLGVFVGGFDAGAAEQVVTGDGIEPWDVVDALVDLVAKSMVVAEPQPDGSTRYQLLETLRHYARERLDERADADHWRRRHAEHFASFAESQGPSIFSADELAARRQITTELDNFRAAVTWGLDSADEEDAELAVRIIAALAQEGSAHRATGISEWAQRALGAADRSTPGRRHAVYGLAATASVATGDYEAARELASSALRDGIPADSPQPLLAHVALANVIALRGDMDGSRVFVEQGVRELEAIGATDWHICVMTCIAAVWHTAAGNLDRALELMDPIVPAARRRRSPTALVIALYAFGWASWQRDPDAAIEALEESARIARETGADSAFGPCLSETARLYARRGDLQLARARLQESLTHSYEMADYNQLSGSFVVAAVILVSVGHPEQSAVIDGFLAEGAAAAHGFAYQFGGPEGEERIQAQTSARGALGDAAYDEAYARGTAMSYDEAVAAVLAELDADLSSAPDA
jgi:predicted ATPase/class 3 adenylate cyclase